MNCASKKLGKALLNLLFPQHLKCHCCGAEAVVNDYGICESCEKSLLFASDPGSIEGADGFSSPLLYNETVKNAMIPFKYHGAVYKKEFLTHFICIPEDWKADCIVPVPLHANRLKSRGYNQSAVLAEVIAERIGVPVREDLLFRIKDTPNQARIKRQERIENVKGAFEARAECKGLSVILIDDVRTTGSTLRECALELKRKGAEKVYAVTACCSMEEIRNGN